MTLDEVVAGSSRALGQIAQTIQNWQGWQRYLAAFVAGLALLLAQPPFGFLPILLIAYPVFYWLLDGLDDPSRGNRQPMWQAAFVGWAAGFGFFLAGLNWIGEAFLVEAEDFGWMMPFAVTLLPAGLALFWGAAFAVARWVWPRGWLRVLVLTVALCLAEWLRGHILTGFPWNLPGQALVSSGPLLQTGALVGIYGMSLLTVLVFSAFAAHDPRNTEPRSVEPQNAVPYDGLLREPRVWQPVCALLSLLVLLWAGGAVRLANATDETVPGVMLRLVQPSVPQADKWRPENRQEILGQFLRMSSETSESDAATPTHIIWPESAIPFLLDREPVIRSVISRVLLPSAVLITGSVRGEPDPLQPQRDLARFYNSLHVVGPDGSIRGTYDKAHLVPFGEYLPLQGWLESIGLEQLTRLRGGYQSGPGPVSMAVPGAPAASPLICYEVIFPGAGIGPDRPGWIVNVTNDAWFGTSIGPHQHLAQARLRAVEQGLPVVRVANTGISAIVGPYGAVRSQLGLNVRGVIDGALPAEIKPTLFARIGDLGFFILVLGLLGLVWARRMEK